jgi:hypothetical protein
MSGENTYYGIVKQKQFQTMKTKQIQFVFVAFLMAALWQGCTIEIDPKVAIVGKWKMTAITQTPATKQEQMVWDEVVVSQKNIIYEYKTDGKIYVYSPNGKPDISSYSVSGNTITIDRDTYQFTLLGKLMQVRVDNQFKITYTKQ